MKLPDLLTQITPLPWNENPTARTTESADLRSMEELKANSAYVKHSANVLPELVKALEDLQAVSKHVSDLNHAGNPISNGTWSSLFASVNEAQAILARANEIKV